MMDLKRERVASIAAILLLVLVANGFVSANEDGEDVSMTVAMSFTIESKILGESRPVLVNLPRGYGDNQQRHPALIVLDGSPTMTSLASASLFDRTIPGFIIVAVPNVDRLRDLSHESIAEIWPTSGGADSFLAFLTDELAPWIDAKFRTSGYRVITGGSAAGRFATFALLEAPEVFDAAIARSPVLGTAYEMFRGLVTSAATQKSNGEHFLFLVYGSHDYPVVTIYTERLLRLLDDQSPPWLRYERAVLDNKGHFQFSGLNAGLSALFEDFEFPADRFLEEGPGAVVERARVLGKRFKMDVQPSQLAGQREIIDAGCELGRQRRFVDAIRVLTYGLELHPYSAALLYYKAQMLEHAGETEEAVIDYNRVFELEPSMGIAGMTRILLDNLVEIEKPEGR